MKLNTLGAVAAALANAQLKKVTSHDNGTFGRVINCFFWSYETVKDKAREKIEVNAARLKILGKTNEAAEELKKIEALEPPSINMIFRIEEPIPELKGTKIIRYADKTYSPKMMNVEYFYVPQDIVNGEFTSFEKLGRMSKDMAGNDAEIIALKLENCILDVKEGAINAMNVVWRQPRAYLTAVSFRSMQVVGTMMNREKNDLRRLYGSIDSAEFDALIGKF